jgi:hypothetical protein
MLAMTISALAHDQKLTNPKFLLNIIAATRAHVAKDANANEVLDDRTRALVG